MLPSSMGGGHHHPQCGQCTTVAMEVSAPQRGKHGDYSPISLRPSERGRWELAECLCQRPMGQGWWPEQAEPSPAPVVHAVGWR